MCKDNQAMGMNPIYATSYTESNFDTQADQDA